MDTSEALKILGLTPTATTSQIKEAYRDLAKVWHPDRFGSDPRLRAKAEETLKRINAAYQFLQSDTAARRWGATGSSSRNSNSTSTRRTDTGPQWGSDRQPQPPKPPTDSPRLLWKQIPLWAYAAIALAVVGLVSASRDETEARNERAASSRPTSGTSAPRPAVVAGPTAESMSGAVSLKSPSDRPAATPPQRLNVQRRTGAASRDVQVPDLPDGATNAVTDSRAASTADLGGVTSPPQTQPANTTIVAVRPRASSESRSTLTSEENASLEAACSQAKYVEGPAAYNRCIADQMARFASAPRRPDFSKLSQPERQSIEAACSQAKYVQGPAAYNRCLQDQLGRLAAAPSRPDLSGLTAPERQSIEAACSQPKYVEGAAAYNRCLVNQLASWAAAPRRPDLSALSGAERQSIEAACSQPKYVQGPAAYNRCLIRQLALLKPH